jgi:5-(carboxyamino)imidazole ribonucleotide synthase
MAHLIEPGATLGVLGGGQLGKLFTAAAQRLGYRVTVWDPDPDAPALKAADYPLPAPFSDPAALTQFSELAAAATYEWENVPVGLATVLEQRIPLRPSSRILGTLQNRFAQKSFLHEQDFPVAAFRHVLSPEQLPDTADSLGYPCVCKTATAGYDGKGQWRLANRDEAVELAAQLARGTSGLQWIVEEWIGFEKELSVVVARAGDGEFRTYPVSENTHENGILITSRVPARIPATLAAAACILAVSVIEALDGIGVFCVELFLAQGRFLINEVAPRPHNSGHYTLDACTVSQFEQQVRALCGLPLGEIRLLSPAVMVNLIGEAFTHAMTGAALHTVTAAPGSVLHVYGKREVRPGRKMGHITILREQADEAWEVATSFRSLLTATGTAKP